MRTFGIFCFAAALALNVHAEVVYDNTAHGNTPGQSTPIDAGPLYDSFSTGALSEALTGLDLVLDSTTGGTDPFDVLLYSDDTNLLDYPSTGHGPGSLVATLANAFTVTLPAGVSTQAVTLSSNPILAANTRYWIALVSDPSTIAGWEFADDAGGTGTAGEFWAFGNPGSASVTQNSDALTPFEMRVTMGVPEPATFFTLFGVMALLALVSFRRRQVQE